MFYEDIKNDPKESIKKLAKFLGEDLSENVLDIIVEKTSFKFAKEAREAALKTDAQESSYREDISPFLRKGVVGDWKNYFSDEESEYMDRRYNETLKPLGINFQYEPI